MRHIITKIQPNFDVFLVTHRDTEKHVCLVIWLRERHIYIFIQTEGSSGVFSVQLH